MVMNKMTRYGTVHDRIIAPMNAATDTYLYDWYSGKNLFFTSLRQDIKNRNVNIEIIIEIIKLILLLLVSNIVFKKLVHVFGADGILRMHVEIFNPVNINITIKVSFN